MKSLSVAVVAVVGLERLLMGRNSQPPPCLTPLGFSFSLLFFLLPPLLPRHTPLTAARNNRIIGQTLPERRLNKQKGISIIGEHQPEKRGPVARGRETIRFAERAFLISFTRPSKAWKITAPTPPPPLSRELAS